MTLRIYEPAAKFGIETTEYHDYPCDAYQIYSGVLHIMRFSGSDLFIPLGSIKLFEKLSPVVETPTKQLTDSDLMDKVDEFLKENSELMDMLAK